MSNKIYLTKLHRKLSTYVANNDPVGLILEGAPQDEYDEYIPELIARTQNLHTIQDVLKEVLSVFCAVESGCIKENCEKIAAFILSEKNRK